MSKKGKISRRELIRNSASLLLVDTIVRGSLLRAMAETGAVSQPRSFLMIQEDGGSPRWMFDLFLTPYSNAGFVSNAHIGTRFTASGGRYTDVEYATVALKGIQVPHLWQFDVAKEGGGFRPLQDLLSNLLNIRGIIVGNDGHDGATALQFSPSGSNKSISALSADESSRPIPAIYAGEHGFVFRSTKGLSPVIMKPYEALIPNLVDPFRSQASSTFKQRRDALSAALSLATDSLNQYSALVHPRAADISKATKSAKDLLGYGFSNINTTWNDLVGKYTGLITRTLNASRESLSGLTDLPIGSTGSRGLEYQFRNQVMSMADLRSLIRVNAEISNLAKHFALAEYVFLNQLSDSVVINPGSIILDKGGGSFLEAERDAHFTGKFVSLLSFAMTYLGYGACLLELIDKLNSAGRFQETVIAMGSEMGRAPVPNGASSEHGSVATSVSVYSGIINGPIILGNVKNNSGYSQFPGSWGVGAPVTALAGDPIDLGHWSSTLATLLRVPRPSARNPLVIESSGQIIPTIELARQV